MYGDSEGRSVIEITVCQTINSPNTITILPLRQIGRNKVKIGLTLNAARGPKKCFGYKVGGQFYSSLGMHFQTGYV